MIHAIIFDLGGVILNIDYGRTIDKLSRLSGIDFAQTYTQHRQDPLFDQFETGKISADKFRQGMKRLLNLQEMDQVSDGDLDEAWNAMLLDIPPGRINFLEKIGTQKRIFLLSNTNVIHKMAFDQIALAQIQREGWGDRLSDLSQLFEKAYYSHVVGDRKPNASIFNHVLIENNLDPSETLFIDDTLGHVEGARSVGLQAFHLTPGQTIEQMDLLSR